MTFDPASPTEVPRGQKELAQKKPSTRALHWAKKRFACTFPRVAGAYRQAKRELHERRRPRDTPFGFRFTGNAAMEAGEFEQQELQLILQCIEDAEVVVNVGANVGYYCCLALHLGRKLIAFEPDPRNLKTLYKNLRINKWREEFEIYPMAISNAPGLVELFGENTGTSLIRGWAGAAPNISRYVPCTTLDNVLGNRLAGRRTFFLVDIEGAELFLLQGAEKQLRLKPQATWMVEISVAEHQPKGISINPNLAATFEAFWSADYMAFTANASLTPVSRQDVMGVATKTREAFATHNFLFAPRDGDRTRLEQILALQGRSRPRAESQRLRSREEPSCLPR